MSKPGVKRGPYKPRTPKPSSAQATDDMEGAPPVDHLNDEPTLDGLDLGLVAGGVSAAWLGHVFGHDKNTIKKKLARCPIAGKNRQTPLYLIKEAACWLVPPKVDIATYIKGMRPSDVPPQLNDAYWSAMGKRQKVLKDAGELWETAAVLKVLGETALHIKNTVKLWTDEVDRIEGLTDKQRSMLTQMADGLLEDIHDRYVTAPSRGQTRSTLSEHDEAPAQPANQDYDDLV